MYKKKKCYKSFLISKKLFDFLIAHEESVFQLENVICHTNYWSLQGL